jgi:hypothetical protein
MVERISEPLAAPISTFASPATTHRQRPKAGSERGEERMEVVFDTSTLPAGKRRQAWRDAICEIYLQVDCQTDLDIDYIGLVREAKLGDVTITDAMLSPQIIRRGNRHIGRFGKDCYYLGIEHIGRGRHPPIRSVIRPPARKRIFILRQRTL